MTAIVRVETADSQSWRISIVSTIEIGIYKDGIHGEIIALIRAAKEGVENVIPAFHGIIHRRLVSLGTREVNARSQVVT